MTTKHIATVEDTTSVLIPVRPCHRPRILVVEKEDDLRQLNAEVLLDAGYQVDTTEDGETAWLALQRQRYDLLVTDQFLPPDSRVELLKKLHTARITLPVIMAAESSPAWEFALDPCWQSVVLLGKSCTFEKLVGMVKQVLQRTAGMQPPATLSTNWQDPSAAVDSRRC